MTDLNMKNKEERKKKAIETRKKEIEYRDQWIEALLIGIKELSDKNYTYISKKQKIRLKDKRYIIKEIEKYERETKNSIEEKLKEAKGENIKWLSMSGLFWWQRMKRYFKDYKKKIKVAISPEDINLANYYKSTGELMSKMNTLCKTEEALLRNQYRNDKETSKINGDVIWEYCSIFDDRTCEHCAECDGMTFLNGEGALMIPQHPNCQCFYIYYRA